MSSHKVSGETVTKYGGLGSIFVHPPCGWVRHSDPSDQISQRVPSGCTLTVGCSCSGVIGGKRKKLLIGSASINST